MKYKAHRITINYTCIKARKYLRGSTIKSNGKSKHNDKDEFVMPIVNSKRPGI